MFWVITPRGGPARDQRGDGAVAAVGLRLHNRVVGGELLPPVLTPALGGSDEGAELDRPDLGPQPARAAEIGNPRFGADAGAGEHHGAARPLDQTAEAADLGVDVAHREVPVLTKEVSNTKSTKGTKKSWSL